jgi:hypothetical protein
MFIATGSAPNPAKLRRSGMDGVFARTDFLQRPREYMPLLWSLADRAARLAINMALLTELFASPLDAA